MTEELTRSLKRQLGASKAKLTNFRKFLDELNLDSLTDETIINLEQRQNKFSNVLLEFESLQSQLEVIVPDEQLEELYSSRNDFENAFNSLLARSKNIQKKYGNSDETVSDVSSAQVAAGQAAQNIGFRDVKFPVINLPTFDGGMEKWLEFRDTYESLVHSNAAMSNIQKYHYLRASLREGASQVIRSIELSAQNYPVAWQSLCDRYNNNKLLIHIHTKALFSLECLHKENANKLRELIDITAI